MINKYIKILCGAGILITLIFTCGCVFPEQETTIHIHGTALTNEIVYDSNNQMRLNMSKNLFFSDTMAIYACANVTSNPGESVLRVRWLDAGGNTIFEERKNVSCGIEGCLYCFNLTNSNAQWESGNYSTEFLISGAKSVQARAEFMIITKEKEKKVCLKNTCFHVELAVTRNERARGLMFRETLDPDKGMLFIFEEEEKHTFWMKNTLIPLDIIWINKDGEVVYISRNTKPCKKDFCPLITPAKNAMYVLEVNSGISDKIMLQTGDKVTFEIDN